MGLKGPPLNIIYVSSLIQYSLSTAQVKKRDYDNKDRIYLRSLIIIINTTCGSCCCVLHRKGKIVISGSNKYLQSQISICIYRN